MSAMSAIEKFNALVESKLAKATGKDSLAKRQNAILLAKKADPKLFNDYLQSMSVAKKD